MTVVDHLYPPQRELVGVIKDLWRQNKPAVFRVGQRAGTNVVISALLAELSASPDLTPIVFDPTSQGRGHSDHYIEMVPHKFTLISSMTKVAQLLEPLDAPDSADRRAVILNNPYWGKEGDDARWIKLLLDGQGRPKYGPLLVIGSMGPTFGLWSHFNHRDYATWELNPAATEAHLRKATEPVGANFNRDFNPAHYEARGPALQ